MSRNSKVYTRNIDGLVDALFDQLQDIRDGIIKPDEAQAFAVNAGLIIKTITIDQRERALQLAERQPKEPERITQYEIDQESEM